MGFGSGEIQPWNSLESVVNDSEKNQQKTDNTRL
jgi:hypothetical protein